MTPEQLKDALSEYAGGVVLLSTYGEDDGDAVMTATAFTPVSLEPPLVLVSVARGGWMHESLARSPTWAVSLLAESQLPVAARFSTPQRPSPGVLLTGMPHHRGPATGALVLDDALCVLECRTDRTLDGGDHELVLGLVLRVEMDALERRPLVHFRRDYSTVSGRAR